MTEAPAGANEGSGSPETEVAPHVGSTGDSYGVEIFSDDVEDWLARQVDGGPESPLFWAPCHWRYSTDWLEVRSVEQLAVLISTAVRTDNNVCFVSATQGRDGRSANVIGLVTRPVIGWAVVVIGSQGTSADVRRMGYRYNNYDSFGPLTAAEICAAWVMSGRLPAGLESRRRTR